MCTCVTSKWARNTGLEGAGVVHGGVLPAMKTMVLMLMLFINALGGMGLPQ